MPLPALPALLTTPVLSNVMTLAGWLTPALAVRVAVQVIPPSLLVRALSVALAMVRSALSKPVTASLKVMVTKEVPSTASAVSLTTMLALGRTVLMA